MLYCFSGLSSCLPAGSCVLITVNRSARLQGSMQHLPVRILPDSLICNQLLWIQVPWTVSEPKIQPGTQ